MIFESLGPQKDSSILYSTPDRSVDITFKDGRFNLGSGMITGGFVTRGITVGFKLDEECVSCNPTEAPLTGSLHYNLEKASKVATFLRDSSDI